VGAYNVKVSFIGYKELVSKVVITPAKSEQDIGNLTISPDAQQLKEVDVTGQKSTVELKVDRKVFNVGNDISARGGTGLDVMKNIPSVSIDASGNVTLRNNTPQVYIDGKPTTLTLEQIPADQIDKVEVITNPSAKFEAASSGGIINVVMKKNTKPGYNGIVNLNLATNTGYNGLAMINLKEKKFGVNLMYTVNGATNRTYGFNNTTYLNSLNQPYAYTDQGINSTFKRLFQVARVGFDFFINNRNTLSIYENAVFGNFNTDDAISIADGIPGTQLLSGNENNIQLNHFRNFTTDMSFKHTYPTEGKEYTLDVQYNHANGGGNYAYTTSYSYANGNIFTQNPTYEYQLGGQHSDQITALADFSLPIGKNMKIETGFRSNYKLTYSYVNVTNDSTLSTGVVGPSDFNYNLSNNYRIDDLVNGVYVTFTHQIKGFSYQLGFRAEEVFYKGTSYQNGDSAFSYQYPTTWSSVPKMLFPSFNISQKIGTQHEIQFNVARKSNRPNFFQIAPFVFSSNATTVQRGNPALQPEFINQGELNYNYSGSKISWLTSVYGRYVQQPITSHISPESDSSQIFVSSYANATHSMTGGWENILKIFPVKKLDITLTGNVFYTDIVGGSNENNSNNAGWSWLAKAMISYKLPGDITIQANGTYEAPKILPQGKTTALYYVDVSASKDFGFFTLNFTVSDVANTRANGTDYYQAYQFIQSQSRRRDQRYAKLGVSFRFGKMDASLFKKKRPSQDSGGGDMGF
jgi:outer membrane receptor protein involved in Fe transport